MPSGLFWVNSLDRSIFYIRGVWIVSIIITFVESPDLNANSVAPDQMLHSAVSDLGLHCLSLSL